MSEKRIHSGVRSLTKQDITDAELVYTPSSEKRYNELVDLFLIKIQERTDEARKRCGSDDAVREDITV